MQYHCWAIADALMRAYLRHGARLTAGEWRARSLGGRASSHPRASAEGSGLDRPRHGLAPLRAVPQLPGNRAGGLRRQRGRLQLRGGVAPACPHLCWGDGLRGALQGFRTLPDSIQNLRGAPASRAENFAGLITARFTQEKHTLAVLPSLSKPRKTAEGTEPLLFNKIFGSTLAGAIGKSMGSIFECLHYRDIEREYGVIDTVLDPGRLETEDDL